MKEEPEGRIAPQHIVIGGGTAGIVLTNQLIRKGGSVILIERGEVSVGNHPSKTDFWTYLCNSEEYSNPVQSTAQAHLADRSIKYPTGKGLGGTSNVNAMLHDVGQLEVYDRYWPRDWNSEVIAQYEDLLNHIVPSTSIESAGKLKEIIGKYPQSSHRLLFSAGKRWSHRSLLQQQWIIDGRLIVIQSDVKQINIKEGKAVSVALIGGDEVIVPRHGGEIILSAGVFGSPQILFRSGITSVHSKRERAERTDDSLEYVDIGENLQDHPLMGTFFFGDWHRGWDSSIELPQSSVHGLIYLDEHGNVLDLKANPKVLPRCQLIVMDARMAAGLVDMIIPNLPKNKFYNTFIRSLFVSLLNVRKVVECQLFVFTLDKFLLHLSIFQWLLGRVYCIHATCIQPKSRGKVVQKNGVLEVDCQLAQHPEDQFVLRNGLRVAQSIKEKAKNDQFGGWSFEILPGPLFSWAESEQAFQLFFKTRLVTYFHPVGTCSMDHFNEDGKAVQGVVNSDLQVKTIKNLRIVDASVIPHIPSFPTAKITMTIAMIAAEKITQSQELQSY